MKQGEATKWLNIFAEFSFIEKMRQGEATKWLSIFFALFSPERKSEKGKA